MGKIIKHATIENLPFWIFAIISAGIGIASFIVPPPGEIHPSVLKFISWMFAFAALWVFLCAFKDGLDARFQKGDVSVTLGSLEGKQPLPAIEEEDGDPEELDT